MILAVAGVLGFVCAAGVLRAMRQVCLHTGWGCAVRRRCSPTPSKIRTRLKPSEPVAHILMVHGYAKACFKPIAALLQYAWLMFVAGDTVKGRLRWLDGFKVTHYVLNSTVKNLFVDALCNRKLNPDPHSLFKCANTVCGLISYLPTLISLPNGGFQSISPASNSTLPQPPAPRPVTCRQRSNPITSHLNSTTPHFLSGARDGITHALTG
ncbi:hypothetical protein C8Q78DRAFT_785265 [Trametes maxima]|nr:hypothetical protein C8Q78DRAFT_785265 [Trametes maxima]